MTSKDMPDTIWCFKNCDGYNAHDDKCAKPEQRGCTQYIRADIANKTIVALAEALEAIKAHYEGYEELPPWGKELIKVVNQPLTQHADQIQEARNKQ